MSIIAELYKKGKSEFPENKIILLDGRTLDCFPVAKKEEVIDDSMQLDTTGRYLSVRGKKLAPTPQTPPAVELLRELFVKNAFYLLAHKERILSDSRMFLCPVHVQNGLAYTGTSGFHHPILGVYIEWWLNCEGALQTDKKGCRTMVYQLAGSPLSGANRCGVVNEKGKTDVVSLSSFSSYWSPFMKINQRYTEAKYKYEAYTLQQVLDILERESLEEVSYVHTIETEFMKRQILALNEKVEQLQKDCSHWHAKYLETIMKYNDTKARELYAEYETFETEVNAEIDGLREQKKVLKASLKSGKINNKAYQRQLMPLLKRIQDLKAKLDLFKHSRVKEVFLDGEITFSMIEQHCKPAFLKRKEITSNSNA